MADTIYSQADIAQLLRVTPAAVSNWLARYGNTPAAQYVTSDGRQYWSTEGMRQWRDWHESTPVGNEARKKRSKTAHDAVEALRDMLEK